MSPVWGMFVIIYSDIPESLCNKEENMQRLIRSKDAPDDSEGLLRVLIIWEFICE